MKRRFGKPDAAKEKVSAKAPLRPIPLSNVFIFE